MQMATISGKTFWCLCSGALFLAATSAHAEQKLFESVQVTPAGEYTFGIEGPAADLDGNLYVVNFGRRGAIGKLSPGSGYRRSSSTFPAAASAIRSASRATG